MNSSNDALELLTDLKLRLGPSSHSTQGSLNDESGVGANAACRAEMKFVDNGPLSELVWSPHKGLSLRCAVGTGSVPEKNSSNFLGAGPSNMVHSPPYSIATESNNDKLAEERSFIALPTISHVEKDVTDEAAILSIASKSYAMNAQLCKLDLGHDSGSCEKVVEMNTSPRINNAQDSTMGLTTLREKDNVYQSNTIQVTEATENDSPGLELGRAKNALPVSDEFDLNARPVDLMPEGKAEMKIGGFLDLNKNNRQIHPLSPIKCSLLQEMRDLRKSKALMLNPSSMCKGHIQSNTGLIEGGKNKMTIPISVCAVPLQEMETTAENKMRPLDNFMPDSAAGDRNTLHGEKEKFQMEVGRVSKASPIRFFASKEKRKEKAVSDDDLKEGASGEDSDSYGSVQSCNGAELSCAGKKRVLGFEERLVVGRKRVKLQMQGTPGSTFFTRSDGSFVNWISTLIKGLSKPNEDRSPALADAGNESEKKGLVACSREQDQMCGHMVFQSIFESLYQQNPNVQDQRFSSSDNHQKSECHKEIEVAVKPTERNKGARTFSPDDIPSLQQKMVSNERLNQSVLGGGQDPQTHSSVPKGSIASFPFDCKTSALLKSSTSAQNSAVLGDVGSSLEFAVRKWKTDSGGDNCFDLSVEEKMVDDSVNKRKQLSHLWMTHFCPKSSRPIKNSGYCKQGAVGVVESSADLCQGNVDCFRDSKDMESQGQSSEEPMDSSFKKLNNFSLDVEVSSVMKRIEGQKVNPIVCSQRFKSSEAMASIFAKRLDALKHILPTDLADKATSSATTCFFCGVIGHDLRACPQVTETEVDELLKNVNAYGGAEELPNLCIRCFQLNHWAVACPNAPSLKKSQSEHGASVLCHSSLGDMSNVSGFRRILNLSDGADRQIYVPREKAGSSSSAGCYRPPGMSTSLDVNMETRGSPASMTRISPNPKKMNALYGKENVSDAPGLSHPCSSVGLQALENPRGIFEAVKSLQLSRTDILKWMCSISYLDGYYLRLRLGTAGRLLEGLGGTGYYVACISGLQGDKSAEASKKPISVIIGGIRCSIESQYISNQDFLEDELMAWWSATIRGGRKIPSEEELRSKVKERRRLGL